MKLCCEKSKEDGAIKWNPYNKVVQCHSCGNIYIKANKVDYLLNRIFKKWGY